MVKIKPTLDMNTGSIIAGYRENGAPWHVGFVEVKNAEGLPPITAVSIVARFENKVIAVKTPRGWGIPSGHLNPDETWGMAAVRELKEEACAKGDSFVLRGAMISDFYSEPTSIVITSTNIVTLETFAQCSEVSERRVVPPSRLIKMYYGNRKIIKKILALGGMK